MVEDSCLPEYDAVLLGEWLSTFQRIVVLSLSIRQSKRTFYPEEEGNMILWTVGRHSPNDSASHPGRFQFSSPVVMI